MKYWLGVVSKEHVKIGTEGGFAQVCHGKKAPLARMNAGDFLVYYSPGLIMGKSELKSFTAIGKILDEDVFSVPMSPDFVPFRRRVSYLFTKDLPVDDVKSKLDLCSNSSWGYKLRFGLIELSESDFELIKEKMCIE